MKFMVKTKNVWERAPNTRFTRGPNYKGHKLVCVQTVTDHKTPKGDIKKKKRQLKINKSTVQSLWTG